jgi:sugar phosphate isomerase/epimerase
LHIQLALSTYSFWRWREENGRSIEDSLSQIRDLGVSAVEFADLGQPSPTNRARVERAHALCDAAAQRGLGVAGYCTSGELLVPPDLQRREIERLKIEVDVAGALGVKSMRHDVSQGFGEHSTSLTVPHTFDAALKIVVPAIREVCDYARGPGIATTVENHGFFCQHSARVRRLVKRVARPNYGVTLDMGNFLCVNENPVTGVRRLAKLARMVHVKDFHVRPRKRMPPVGWFQTPTKIALRGAIVGHGEIDIPAQIQILRSADYRGYMSLEFEGIEEPIFAITQGLAYLRQILGDR